MQTLSALSLTAPGRITLAGGCEARGASEFTVQPTPNGIWLCLRTTQTMSYFWEGLGWDFPPLLQQTLRAEALGWWLGGLAALLSQAGSPAPWSTADREITLALNTSAGPLQTTLREGEDAALDAVHALAYDLAAELLAHDRGDPSPLGGALFGPRIAARIAQHAAQLAAPPDVWGEDTIED